MLQFDILFSHIEESDVETRIISALEDRKEMIQDIVSYLKEQKKKNPGEQLSIRIYSLTDYITEDYFAEVYDDTIKVYSALYMEDQTIEEYARKVMEISIS